MRHALLLLLWTGLLSPACGLNDFRVCPTPAPAVQARLPVRLSETGLFVASSNEILAPGVRPYTPRFQLWSDGADKRRFISLPAGTRIDSADMDDWHFPEGTRLWKEFARDGVRVETRLLMKLGPRPEDWAAMAYLWQPDGQDAHAVPDGVVNARGTTHDVPAAAECAGCHGGRKSRVLGFSAVQLAEARPGLGLDELVTQGLLTRPPAAVPRVPGDETARAALGYLHANCAHCHNQTRPARAGDRCFDPENRLDFHLPAEPVAAVENTPAYRTAVDLAIQPGRPGDSRLLDRMRTRGNPYFASMPPLGTELVHNEAIALLSRFIAGLR